MIMNNVNSNHNQKLVHYMRLDHKRKIYTFMDKKLTIDAFFASTRRTTSKQIGIFLLFSLCFGTDPIRLCECPPA